MSQDTGDTALSTAIAVAARSSDSDVNASQPPLSGVSSSPPDANTPFLVSTDPSNSDPDHAHPIIIITPTHAAENKTPRHVRYLDTSNDKNTHAINHGGHLRASSFAVSVAESDMDDEHGNGTMPNGDKNPDEDVDYVDDEQYENEMQYPNSNADHKTPETEPPTSNKDSLSPEAGVKK